MELKVEANNVDKWRCFNSKLSRLESSIQSEPEAHSFNKDVSTPIKYSYQLLWIFLTQVFISSKHAFSFDYGHPVIVCPVSNSYLESLIAIKELVEHFYFST